MARRIVAGVGGFVVWGDVWPGTLSVRSPVDTRHAEWRGGDLANLGAAVMLTRSGVIAAASHSRGNLHAGHIRVCLFARPDSVFDRINMHHCQMAVGNALA